MKNLYKVLLVVALLLPALVFAQKPAKFMVKPTKEAFNIDGVADEAAWAAVPKTAINKPYAGETVVGGDATFQMLYDKENLYIFVDVTDDVVTLDNGADWKGDKFEVYFGLPGYVPGKGAGEEHARQFFGNASQAWVDDTTQISHPTWYDKTLWPGVALRSTDGISFGYVETLSGYTYEFKINKSALENVNFATIDSLGFDFCLADNDVEGDGKGVRNRKMYYNDASSGPKNENWGAMYLAGMGFTTEVALSSPWVVVSDQSAYIAYDILRFKGYDKPVDVDVYSVVGQKLLSVKNVNEVNVAELKSGIYIVRVDGTASYKVAK